MRQSTNYELNLVEGSDLVNPLTQDVPNYEKIDEVMKSNENASIGKAVELVSATVHAITRTWKDTPVFRFTATANYTAGETFTVDGLQVTALLPSGEPLASNCYISGSEVICSLNSDTMLMTVFVSGGTVTLAQDSERLGGELPDYYASKTEVDQAQSTATAAGVLAQAAQSAVTALESKITTYIPDETAVGVWIDGRTIYRKVYSADNVSYTSGVTLDNSLNSNNIMPIKMNPIFRLGSEYLLHEDSTVSNRRFIKPILNASALSLSISNFTVNGYVLIIDYVKK